MLDVMLGMSTFATFVFMLFEGLPVIRSRLWACCGAEHAAPVLGKGQWAYVAYVAGVMFLHLLIAAGASFHFHHFWGGFMMCTFSVFPTLTSKVMFCKGFNLMIDGIGVWG